MEGKDLPDWEAFERELEGLRAEFGNRRSLLFRGLNDSELPLTTTLERAGCEEMSFSLYYRLVDRIRPAVETFTGVNWDVPDYSGKVEESFHDVQLLALPGFPSVPFYRYLVYLRHHRFPSPSSTGPTRRMLQPSSPLGIRM